MSELFILAEQQRAGKIQKRVETFSALRSFEPESANEAVLVLGGATVGDINAGIFYFDETDTTAADNNSTVIVTTSGARWKFVNLSFATKLQGQKADSALQPGDNISQLDNNSNFRTGAQVTVTAQAESASAVAGHVGQTNPHAQYRIRKKEIAGTSYTIQQVDDNYILIFDTASPVTLTLPEDATEFLEEMTTVYFRNKQSGDISVAIEGTDVLIGGSTTNDPTKVNSVYLEERDGGINTYVCVGDFV
jgi:hypothetical protein